jgi:predicted dehydrogenase
MQSANNDLSQTSRPLRLGMVGGGLGSFIGETHRIAARMDGCYEICASAFSSHPDRAQQGAQAFGIPLDRSYSSWQELIAKEAKREDKIDVISVLTPNDSHLEICLAAMDAGFHVMCEKPITNDLASAQKIAHKVQDSGVEFCVAYCYSAYPLVRQAQSMVRDGAIGTVRQIHVQYIQGNLADRDLPDAWRTDPAKGGKSLVLLDIGTHAYHLACTVSGLQLEEVCADVGSAIPERMVHDYVSAMLNFEGGAKGSLWVTNAAAGSEHGLSIRIHGDLGGLEWHQESPNRLIHRQQKGFEQIITRRLDNAVSPAAQYSSRIGVGHPEGYLEAFANLYRELAQTIHAKRSGLILPLGAELFPKVQEGLAGLAFVEAAVRSSQERKWVSC